MCRFIETLRIENGRIFNLRLHNLRLNRTLKLNGIHSSKPVALEEYIHPERYARRTKCHVDYGPDGVESVTYTDYHPRVVHSLRLLDADDLDYHFKYADRSRLDQLYELRNGADDILIVKDGFITDTTIANVTFYDGNRWFTPTKPILSGTKRRSLLEDYCIFEKEIPVDTVYSFKRVGMINAMLDFHEMEFDITPATIIYS